MYTISPYNENFFDHIDADIKDLVHILLQKGYLPFSSCQGHNGSRKFIAIVTYSEINAKKISKYFNFSKIVIKHLSENSTLEFKRNSQKLVGIREPSYSTLDQIKSLNSLYIRNYQDYWILEIIFKDKIQVKKDLAGLPFYVG